METTPDTPEQAASLDQRLAAGRLARKIVPREAHVEFAPGAGRDPIGLLERQAKTFAADLVPVRHGRMLVSPVTFHRGAALVMAADLRDTPTTGLRVQLCGDAHLSNFGVFATPERRLIFDINDYDETLPGSFEWDVKRLAASLVVAGQDNDFSSSECRRAALTAVQAYRLAIQEFATQPMLNVWYKQFEVDESWNKFTASLSSANRKKNKDKLKTTSSALAKARTRDSMQAANKLTTVTRGHRRIVSDSPLVVPLEQVSGVDPETVHAQLADVVAQYRSSLPDDRRVLFDSYRLTDVAHKVVGVANVGARAWVLLFEGARDSEFVLLQARQAQASVLADYAGASQYNNQGQRVVAGQSLMQSSSDIFLGWVRSGRHAAGTDYYIRQLRDWKHSADVEGMNPTSTGIYAAMCGRTLARAHARSGDRFAIAGYVGSSAAFDNAVADFAVRYAEQNERDHAALRAAVASGRLTAVEGV